MHTIKRLIKKANLDLDTVVNAIYAHINEPNPNELINISNNIINNDADCIYNGTMYRGMILNINCKTDDGYVNKDDLITNINDNIYGIGKYHSFSKYDYTAQRYLDDHMDEFNIGSNSISIIISQDGTGIDMNKLIKKYMNLCQENNRRDLYNTLNDIYQAYNHEEEIFSQLDNFIIEEINEELVIDLESEILLDNIYL